MKLTESNYYDREANESYMSVSQFKQFLDCPAAAMAQIRGEYERPKTTALLEGSYIDAFFADTLSDWVDKHQECINKRSGELKAEYRKARIAAASAEADEGFMKYLGGEKQKIITGELFGIEWKAKPDFVFQDKIVDLKYMKDIKSVFKDGERMTFVQAYKYDIQGFVYQQLEYRRKGTLKPFYLAVITKEEPADRAIIELPQYLLNSAGSIVEHYTPIFSEMKNGARETPRCEHCAYCRSTKKTDRIMQYEELLETV